jgi:hypothetical protein
MKLRVYEILIISAGRAYRWQTVHKLAFGPAEREGKSSYKATGRSCVIA